MRQGSRVERESFDDLDQAVAALASQAQRIREAGPLAPRKMLRQFEPADQVAGRIEISTGGFLRLGDEAGLDVMGDGTLIPYRGGMRRTELDPGEDPIEAVRTALR